MRLMDERSGEVVVARDTARHVVELQIVTAAADASRVVRLTSMEARRVAALILLQAAKLERSGDEGQELRFEREAAFPAWMPAGVRAVCGHR